MQYFVSISAYTGTVAGKQSKKKDNDQELTKYFINNCGSFWIMRVCMLFYEKSKIPLSLPQSVPWAPNKWGQSSLCICRDGSGSRFSEFIDY